MKKNNKITIFLIILIYNLLLALPVYADELIDEQEDAQSEQVLTGVQTIDGKTYYFDNEGKMQTGFITIDNKLYFFSRVNGALKTGWQTADEGIWYQNANGEVVTGWQTINNNKYYFNENGIEVRGFITIDNKFYFFSRVNGALKKGWQTADEGIWYQNANGEVVTGWQTIDKNKYYFDENGIEVRGFITIDNKLYFFSRVNGALKKGWQTASEGTWYQLENGEVLTNPGWNTINNKEYYFENNYAYCGIHEVEGKKYYFDEKTCERITKTKRTQYKEIIIDSNSGEYIKTQYLPTYYNQKDTRWANKKYGLSTVGSSGCAPTSMAMAYTAYLERQVLPTDVASYLYNNTNQFNKIFKGTSGKGIIYASNHYNVKYNGIDSKEKLINELKNGKIVFAAMQNGTFATLRWNHAIILFNYNEKDNTTFAYDPLNKMNNRWHKIDIIWNEQSTDPDDRTGGYAIYSLEK